uniref:Uncharacterized protein n=1 Tax=Phenylobacterium glaciei TaxID=2803784 RepID=A0A974P1I9_9CAUL|nr:hypothetical protein JKL49_19150 [Phenylobacterium glaciei]
MRAVMANNLIFDPGQRILHYNLQANEWGDHPYQTGQIVAVGNAMRAGISTPTRWRSSNWAVMGTSSTSPATTSPWTASAGRCRCWAATPPDRPGSSRPRRRRPGRKASSRSRRWTCRSRS